MNCPTSTEQPSAPGLRPAARALNVGRLLLVLLLCASAGPMARAQAISREYQLKAAFLYNFTQFTEWPTNAFATSASPIVVGVLGTDPFGEFLDQTVRGEVVHGRPLVVERYRKVEEIKTCHILFISQSETRRLEDILKS